MPLYGLGAATVLEKFAFGPEDAQKVLSLVKARQLPKASGRNPKYPGLGAMAPRLSDSEIARFESRLEPAGLDFEDIPRATHLLWPEGPGAAQLRTAMPGLPIFPGRGSTKQQLALGGLRLPSGPIVPAAQQKMFHAVSKGHELDESAVPFALGAKAFGHNSPDVLFREHNRLVTLPPGNEAVKGVFTRMRTAQGRNHPVGHTEAALFPPQIPYGEGPRLSRHARKRLTELVEEKAIKDSSGARL